MSGFSEYPYVTSVQIENGAQYNNLVNGSGGVPLIEIKSDIGNQFIEINIRGECDFTHLQDAFTNIEDFLINEASDRIRNFGVVQKENIGRKGVESYYFASNSRSNLDTITFRGDGGITEKQLRREMDWMIEEMKEKDML